jgi:phenylacetyl-CoA:acceptor oxidoreductase subunit 2
MILQAAKGIPAWRLLQIVPLIVATGLTEGCGLFLVMSLTRLDEMPLVMPVAVALVVLLAARGLSWLAYSTALRKAGAPIRTVEILDFYRPWFRAFALVLPVVAIVVGFIFTATAPLTFAFGGLCAFASGWALKFIIVTWAGYNQGFALNHTPVRGSGAAGPLVKPGWFLPEARSQLTKFRGDNSLRRLS